VQRQRSEFARRFERVDDQRRESLLGKLQDANVRLATIRARLQAVGDKLLYAGVVRSKLARGPGGDPVIKVYRNDNDMSGDIAADEDTKLMPGDVVEVRLRLEGLPKFSDSRLPGSAGDEDQKEGVGPRK
jgi:polysaccharide export outer membrane protein